MLYDDQGMHPDPAKVQAIKENAATTRQNPVATVFLEWLHT